jgi:DNA-binding transcriptional LysR family regulator
MNQQIQLSTIQMFCKAAELGSFTTAALSLGLTPAAVSRGIGRLEARLGVPLFVRTTRSMQLSNDGELYYAQCKTALAQIDEAERSLSGRQIKASGRLRISVPTTYGHYRLIPNLPIFHKQYPDIHLELNISNRNIDFVEEGFDLAIRLGTPPDSRLVARHLEDARLGIYASTEYLHKHGSPKLLTDLTAASSKHQLLGFVLPSTGKVMPWLFSDTGKSIELAIKPSLEVTDDPLGCVNLANSGLGLVQTFEWIAQQAPNLKEVLKPYNGRSRAFHLVSPKSRLLSARVRAFVDFISTLSSKY